MSYEKLNVYCRFRRIRYATLTFITSFLVSKRACGRKRACDYLSRINNYVGNVCPFSKLWIAHETRVIEWEDVERCDEKCWEGNTLNAEETEHGRFCLVGEGKRSLPIARLDWREKVLPLRQIRTTVQHRLSGTSIRQSSSRSPSRDFDFFALINDILIDQVTLVRLFREQSLISSDIYFINFLLFILALYIYNSESINHHYKGILNKIIIYIICIRY